MSDIYDYTDYRKFLEDYFEKRKNANSTFSYQFFAQKAGFANKGYVYNLFKGKRNLSKSNLFKVCKAVGFNNDETEYFENLVSFNQAKGLNEKNYYFERLSQIHNRCKTKSQMLHVRKEHYDFYSTWYHSAVRSIIDMYEFKGDYKWLSRMVYPQISIKKARQSVELLCKLGMLEKHKNGIFTVTAKNITSGNEIVGLAIQKFHTDCTDLAKKAIEDLSKEERNMTGLTMGISQVTYKKICEEILLFQNRIAELVNKDIVADQVFQLNFHMFPLSKKENTRKKI